MRNQEKNRKKLLGLIFFFVLLLSFSVGVAIWVVINQDSEEVPGEYFPYDYDVEQEKIFTGKLLEIDNNLVAEPDSAITRIEYYFYNHDDENPLTKVEEAIYPGTYLVKVYANMTDAEGNVSEHEITNVKFDIKKRPIKITVADSDLIYGDKEDKITQSVTYSGYDDITESGFIEGDDESDLGITAENPINYSHSYEQFSNVGNYTLYATGFSSPYYEIEVINGDIDVSPYCLTYSWDEDSFKDIFYNSAGQVPTASTSATLRVQDVCNVIVNVDGEESQINQGTYKATIIGVSNSNYCISGYENDVKDFTIKPLVLKFKWDYPTGGFIYNGKDQKLEATPTNAYASDGITLNTTGTGKHANLKSDCTTKLDGVSRYKSTVESINNNELGNYALPASGLSSEFDIAPKEVSIIWTDLSFIYNGSANTPTATVVATTLIAGDSCLVNYDDGEVNANYIDDNTPIEGKQKYTILPTGLSNTDYRLSSDEASITGYYIVKQKELGITWRNDDLDSTIGKIAYTHVNASTTFHPYADINASDIVSGDSPSLVYEGEQSAANAKLSGEMQVDEETGLAKAEYTAKAKLANEKGNYKLSTDEALITKNFIIKTAPVYPEWDQTEQVSVFAGRKMARDAITTIFSRVYNSQSQLPIAKITNAAGEALSDDLCQVIVHAQEEGFEEWIEEAINAGSYYVETIKVSNTNYELAEVIGASLTIQPKDVYITWGNLVRHYNGSYQNASVSIAADVFENDDCYVKVDILYSKREANAYYTEAFDDPSDLFGDSYLTSLAKNDNGDYALFGEDARNYQFGPDIEGRRNEFEKEFIIKQTLLNVSALRKEITYGDYPTLELEKYISADNLQGTDTIEDLGTLNAKISYNQYDDVSAADDSYNAIWEGATNTNYHYVYHKANYFVKPKPVTITWSVDTDHTYDGTYWHPSVTIAGIVNNDSLYCDFSGSEIESNAKTAREYTATVTNLNSDNDKAKNYLLTGDNYDHAFTISQRELTISWDKVSFVYNAELRFPEYTIGNVVDRDIDTLKVVEDTTDYRKNVEYAINADILETNDLNYILPLNNSTEYEITPIILELTWTGLDLTYNGSPQIITPNIFGVLEVEKDLIDVYATDKKINAGDYTATAYLSGNELGNYALPEVHAKDFEIKKVKLTVTLNNHTIIYGEEPTHNNYVLSGFVNNENDSVIDTNNLEYSYSYRQFQNIGSNYKIMATGLDAINYYFEYKDGTLKVDPKEVTISWNVASQYIYNSDYQAPTAEVTNLVNNDTCSVTVSQFVVAGDHTSQVTALGNNNYTYSVIHTQDFTILRKEVTIAWSVGTYTYNKSTQAPTYTPSGIIAGDLCSVEVTGAGMNAGTYTLNAALTGSDKDNYIIKTNSTCGYTIKPKPVSVNWTVISKEYNGEAQFPTYNLVGGISGDVLGETLSESQTNAGTYTSSINSLTNANYILDETKSTTFRITPVQLSISWGEVSFDYNGRPQKPTAEIAGLVPVDTGKVTVTVNGEQTNAGTYDATAILGGDSGMNYILPTDGEKQAFTINKLWLTVTINNHSIIYGAEPSANGYMITGYIDGEGIDNISVINAKYVHEYTQYGDIGDYDISMTGFAAINYDFRYNNAQLSVTPKEVQIAWTVADYYEYDQQEHAPTATITNLVRPEDSCTVTVSKFVNAGTHSSVVTDLSNKNYYFTSESVGYSKAFTINPRCLDLSWSSLPEYIYNKTTQAPTIASVGGVLAGDVCEVKINGAGMNAGDYTLTTELTGSDKDNYVIKTNATCQYSIKPKTVTIAWSNTTTTYNGGAQAPTYDIVGKYAGDEFDVAISDSVTDAGNYPFVIDALGNNNYVLDLTTNSTTFVIEKIKLTVTWTDTEFTYNGQFRKPTATLDNVLSCDIDEVKVNVSGEQKDANDAYEATATISGNKSGNYEFASDEDKVTFKINKKLLHVYANETSICYGSLPDYCEVTYIGFADGEDSRVLSGELVYASTYNRFDDITTEENIYFISVSGLSSDNYDFEYHAAQLIVYPLDIEIRWENTEVTYNAEFQHPTATIINLARPEDVVDFAVNEFKDAGTHQVSVGFITNPNYTCGEDDRTEFIIKHKEVSITWTNLSFNYDGSVKTPTVILDGVIEGDPCVANIDGGTNEVGTHTATVTGLSNTNYVLIGDNLSATFTIKKLVIIIIIGNSEVTYGDSLAEQGQFTYTYDEAGFEDGDTFENSITGEIYFETDYHIGMSAGRTLPITAGGLSSDKYEISYQVGTLTVNRRTAYFTWGNTQLTYNGELQAPEAIFTNVIEGDTVNPIFDSKYRDYSEEYYEAHLIGVDNQNYEPLGDMAERFYINKAPLTITPLANEITYGDILSGKGVTYHGFMGDDDYTDLEGTLTYVSDTYDQSSPVGKYAFRASGLTARNYEITFEVSELTVKQKDVTITWIATTLTYTGLAQNPNYTYEGIFDDDLEECQVKVTGAINAGTKHQATISLEGDKASNYKVVNETSPEFTIGKAPLRVIAEANEITYGDLPTNAGIRFEGFVNNEKENVLTGSLAFDYTYRQFDAISSTNNKYYIKPSGYSSTNYSITFVNGELTVNPFEVLVSWSNLEFTYDGQSHIPTATVTNALNNDVVTVTVDGEKVNAGNTYIATAISVSNNNYKLAEIAPTTEFVIKAKSITVSWSNTSLTYNGTTQKPTAEITSESGVVGSESVPLTVDASGKDAATHNAIVSTTNTNYVISNSATTYTIAKATVTVAWKESTLTQQYTGKALFPEYEIIGIFTDYDNESSYQISESEHKINANTNGYAVSISFTSDNYVMDEETNKATFIINPVQLEIVWSDFEFTYNAKPHLPTASISGFVEGETDTITVTVEGAQTDAGTHTATASLSSSSNNENYILPTTGQTKEFVINKAILTVTPNDHEITYGDDNSHNGVTYTGFIVDSSDTIDNINLTGNVSYSYTYTRYGNVGSYKISIDVADLKSTNYEFEAATEKAELVVKKRSITIIWTNTTLPYNGFTQYPTASTDDIYALDLADCIISVTGARDCNYGYLHESVATLTGDKAINYEIGEGLTQTFTITPKAITVLWGSTDLTYNGAVQHPTVELKDSSEIFGDDEVTLKVEAYGKDVKDGTYKAIVTTPNTNYTITSNASIDYTIKKADLTVSWENTTVPYNGKGQFPTYEISGLLGDDTEDAYTVIPSGSYQTVKTHTASISITSNNYQLAGVTETLFTITAAQLEIVWDIEGLIYNGANQKPTATISGLVDGESGTVTVTVTVEGEHKNAGTYTATATLTGTAGDNYILPDAEQSIEYAIAQKVVKVTPNTSEITYGEAPIHNGVSYNGFIDGETIDNIEGKSGNIIYDYEYEQYGDVLDQWFDITIGESTLASTNYKFEYVIGGLFVKRRKVTITWQEPLEGEMIQLEYNGRPQAPNFTASGILDRDQDICSVIVDGFTDVTPAYQVYTSEAFIYSTVDNKASNYHFYPEENAKCEFIIYPKRIYVDVRDATYNESTGFFELVYNGYDQKPDIYLKEEYVCGNDTVTLEFTGTGKDVKDDHYTTNVTTTNANYYVDNNEVYFKITKATIKVTANNLTITYGAAPTGTGVTYDGFLGEDTASVVTGSVTNYTSTYTQFGDVGSNYTITPVVTGLSATNYKFEAVAGELTVNKAKLTVTANAHTITYGDAPTGNGVTYSGFVAGSSDNIDNIGLSGEVTNYTSTYTQYGNVGNSYTITPVITGLSATNYEFEAKAGELTVNKKPVTITWGETELIYSGSAQAPTATVNPSDLIGTDQCTVNVTGAQTEIGSSYQATASSLSNANYVLSGNNLTINFSIIKELIDLVVTVTNISTTYGDSFTFAVKYTINGEEVALPSGVTSTLQYTVTLNGVETNDYLNAGSYKVIASGLTDSTGVYNFIYNEGSLDIAKANLTINLATVNHTYGDTFHTGSISSCDGLVNGDTVDSLGINLTYTTSVNSSTSVSDYVIPYSANEITLDNYNVTINDGMIKVVQREVTVTWKTGPFTYTGKAINPITFGNVVNGDILTPSFTDSNGTTVSVINAKTYSDLVLSGLGNNNYKLPSTGITGSITINAARIKLSITLYSEDYTSNLTWSTIQSRLKNQITFVDADNTDVTVSLNSSIYTVSGMHNGLYGYGTHGVDGLEDSPTEHIVGSTYAVIVKLVSSNYVLEGNTYFIFKYQTAKIGSKYYTIEDAIAQTGTISFAGNLANSSAPSSYVATSFCNLSRNQGSPYTSFEYTINNRKLLVPFENSTSDRSLTSTGQIANYVYSALIIPESVTLKLTGTASLVVGGKIDFAQPRTTAVCNHGVIMNYGTIDAASGTSITAYGYIKGKDSDDSSRIILRAGSTTTDCLSTYDWVGGTAASKVVSSVFPANAWSLHNISCKSYIYSGASYKGFIYTIVSGEQIYTTADIIGKNSDSNCLFKPSASATSEDYILKDVKPASSWSVNSEEYKAMNTIIGSNQIKGQKDIIEVHGDYEDAQLKISMKITIVISIPVNFSTSTSISAPLGYADVIVAKGSVLSLSKSDYMFMPGTTLTIDEGGVVNVANGVDLAFMSTTDILEYNDSLGGFNTHCIDKTDAKAIVNGELNVSGNIGGYIDTSAEGGVLTVSGGITANYTMLTSSGGDGKDTTVSSTKSSIGNINLIDDSNFASGSAYISTTDGTIYYWKSAENVKTFKFEFYAEDGTTLLSTKNIYVVLENANDAYSYTITGFEYTPTKLHYDFAGWLDESGKIASGTELTDASLPIKLIASWTEHEYLISYSGGYSIDGQITDVSNSMILSENAMESFFISDFVGDKLSIPTVASYTYNNLSLLFNGWFVGTDSSSGIKINSITKAQLEKFIENYGINSPIPLYCEFTNDKFFNVIINDSNGKSILDGQNSLGFMVKENNSIVGSGYTISVNSDNIDNNPDEQYYFNGFKDSQGNVYSLDELVNLKISSDMNLTVNWSQKSKVIYKDHEGNVIGNPLWVLSGTTISLALSQSRDAVSGDKYNTQYSFAGWKDSVTNTIIAGGSSYNVNSNEITFTAEYTPTYIYILTVDVDNSTISVNGTAYTADAEIIYYVNSTSETVSVSFTATGNSTKYLKVTWDGNELYADSNKDYSGTQTLSKHTVLGAIGTNDSSVCFAEGTLITLADGSKKAIENLENTDMLLVFNHITGKHDVAPATFLIHKGAEKSYHRVINLKFSDDTILRIIGYHGLYSKTANDYVYISENNIDNYLGHEFYTEKGKTIKLNDYHITNEYINVYSPISSYHLNCFAEGILTVSNFTEFMMNMFEYEEDMTYNEAEIQLEIAKYGLTTYDDFKDYVSYEVYCMFPAQYMNIAIGKGLITKGEIIELINEYLIPYQLK